MWRPATSQSFLVKERPNDMTFWEGVVESFNLDNHPKAQQAFAWEGWERVGKKTERKYTVMLKIPPVDSPYTAVQIAIASEARE